MKFAMSTAFLTKHRVATLRSPSPLNGVRVGVRILRNESSRFDPLNRPGRVGRGVLTAPRLSEASSKSGGGVRTPSPTFRFMGSPNLQQSDVHWDHEPSPTSHRFKAFMDQRKAIPGRFESLSAIPRFMERILRNDSRLEPLNRQRQVGLGVLTPPRPSRVSSMLGGGVRTPSPTFRFVGRARVNCK